METAIANPDEPDDEKPETTDIVPQMGQLAAIPMSAAQMREAFKAEDEKWLVLKEWIGSTLVVDVDYGVTPGADKPSLWQPGARKIADRVHVRRRWARDTETWEMLGKPQNLILYVCELYVPSTGEVISEGRGCCGIERFGRSRQPDHWFTNRAIKMAKKSSFVDAVLGVAGVSELFTQDTDAPPKSGQAESEEDRVRERIEGKGQSAEQPSPAALRLKVAQVVQDAWKKATGDDMHWVIDGKITKDAKALQICASVMWAIAVNHKIVPGGEPRRPLEVGELQRVIEAIPDTAFPECSVIPPPEQGDLYDEGGQS